MTGNQESPREGSVQPIRPEDIASEKEMIYPDAVLEAFNELIARNFVDGMSRVLQKAVVQLMVEKGLDINDIDKNGWLNVEDIYSEYGWDVEYDKPGFNESYDASFTFTVSRKRREDR